MALIKKIYNPFWPWEAFIWRRTEATFQRWKGEP